VGVYRALILILPLLCVGLPFAVVIFSDISLLSFIFFFRFWVKVCALLLHIVLTFFGWDEGDIICEGRQHCISHRIRCDPSEYHLPWLCVDGRVGMLGSLGKRKDSLTKGHDEEWILHSNCLELSRLGQSDI